MLQGDFNQNFGEQQSILGHLTSILSPIAEAGPDQQGFSPAELAARNTNAIDTTGANYANAERATQGELAGRGVPGAPQSGIDQQIESSIASAGAGQLSNEENQIVAENYATGRQNFNNAVSGLGGVASQYDPNAYAGSANTANKNAFGEADEIAQQEAQEDAEIGGAVAGVAGAVTGGIGNLDTTGGSSFGEQLENFAEGA